MNIQSLVSWALTIVSGLLSGGFLHSFFVALPTVPFNPWYLYAQTAIVVVFLGLLGLIGARTRIAQIRFGAVFVLVMTGTAGLLIVPSVPALRTAAVFGLLGAVAVTVVAFGLSLHRLSSSGLTFLALLFGTHVFVFASLYTGAMVVHSGDIYYVIPIVLVALVFGGMVDMLRGEFRARTSP